VQQNITMNINSKFSHISKFALVGIIATAIHSAIYWFMISLLFDPQLSNFLAFCVALIWSFLGHKNWTFKTQTQSKTPQIQTFSKFLTSALFGLALNAGWVELSIILSINPAYAVIGIGLITPILTFFILKKWVFRES